MKKVCKQVAIFVCVYCFFSGLLKAQNSGEITITIKAEPKQTFQAFGSSQVSKEFGHVAEEPYRSQMADLVYKDLKATVLRLWVSSGPDVTLQGMKDGFCEDYVNSGVIELLQKRGVTTLLLAPARGMEAPKDSIAAYAEKIAQFILEIKQERGVEIGVTGVANEPEGWSGAQMVEAVQHLRTQLDRRGLIHVGIIAPENPSANDVCTAQLDALYASKEAWAGLRGVATHSYNMAARDAEAKRLHGKEYWMTEASDDGNEHGEDEGRASSITARFLNDLNHGVTHWIFFKGFSYSPDVKKDDYTASRISQYDAASGAVVTHLKYYYLKQLLYTIEPGAIIRRCESDKEADMVYTYGQKPKLCASSGVNTDGSVGIGIVNITGAETDSAIAKWYPAQECNVTVRIEDPKLACNRFTVWRSRANHHFIKEGAVEMKDGALQVTLAAREFVCLRSDTSKPGP